MRLELMPDRYEFVHPPGFLYVAADALPYLVNFAYLWLIAT